MKSNKSFCVLTVTKRIDWERMAEDSIERQTIQPNKWIVVTEQNCIIGKIPSVVLFAPKRKRLSNLNASLNQGLRIVDTDYVIFYQDFIELKEDCFEKLLNLADEKTFVTTCTPHYDGTDDIRYTGVDTGRVCRPEEWEANVAIAPMKMIRELGGFDERLDNGWSWDNVLLAKKAAILGSKFVLDESNRPKLYPHDMISHNTLPPNGVLCNQILKDIREGKEDLNCRCL